MNVFNKYNQAMLNKRLEKLNAMCEYLSTNYSELKAISFLEWIALYKNILANNPIMYALLIQTDRQYHREGQPQRDDTNEIPRTS